MDIIFHPNCWDNLSPVSQHTLLNYMYQNTTDYNYCYQPNIFKYKSINDKYLIPLDDVFASELCEFKNKYRDNNYKFMTCNEKHIIDNLSNKVNLSKHQLQEFLPTTYSFDTIKYPCIVKLDIGGYSEGVFKINDNSGLTQLLNTNIQRSKINIDYIIQEAILGNKEYSTQFLVSNGKIIFHSSYYCIYYDNLFVWPHDKIKHTTHYDLDENSTIFNTFQMFFTNYNGLINCNYKIIDNKLKIFEFNPRLSGDIYYIKKKDIKRLIDLYCKYSV